MKPQEIEDLSFEIIEQEAGDHGFDEREWSVVRRLIHTSADFEYKETVRFHKNAITSGLNAIRNGKNIITDTNMARVGIRKTELGRFGAAVTCYMNAPRVHSTAKSTGHRLPIIAGIPPIRFDFRGIIGYSYLWRAKGARGVG